MNKLTSFAKYLVNTISKRPSKVNLKLIVDTNNQNNTIYWWVIYQKVVRTFQYITERLKKGKNAHVK